MDNNINNIEYELINVPDGLRVLNSDGNELSIGSYVDSEKISVEYTGTPLDYFYIEVPMSVNGGWLTFTRAEGFGNNEKIYYSNSSDQFSDWEIFNGTINLKGGEKYFFKSNLLETEYDNGIGIFHVTDNQHNNSSFTVGGNIASLISGDTYTNINRIPKGVFKNLFAGSKVNSAELLVFPECTSSGCCYNMFIDCSNLLLGPVKLASNVFEEKCYSNMFLGCSNLSIAPNIYNGERFLKECFNGMFSGCKMLEIAPEITMSIESDMNESCFSYMFNGCESLITAPELPASGLAENCYSNMFAGCTSLTTAPELPATTLTPYCYQGMFKRCASLTTAPDLPAKQLVGKCYYSMFEQCFVLTTLPNMSAIMCNGSSCCEKMFCDCRALVTVPKNYLYNITELSESCYSQMFVNCFELTSAPDLPIMTLKKSCYSEMFSGCTSLSIAPSLPANILKENCYKNMFFECDSLSEISFDGRYYNSTNIDLSESNITQACGGKLLNKGSGTCYIGTCNVKNAIKKVIPDSFAIRLFGGGMCN